jgi:hypothetical protein
MLTVMTVTCHFPKYFTRERKTLAEATIDKRSGIRTDSTCMIRIGEVGTTQIERTTGSTWSSALFSSPRINRVRLHLQGECLSDICDADGVELQPSMWNQSALLVMSQSTMLWSVQTSRAQRHGIYTHKVRIYDEEVDKTIGTLDLLGQPTSLARSL